MSQDGNSLSQATSKLTLNPNAAEWKPNFAAKEFIPGNFKSASPAPSPAPAAASAPSAPATSMFSWAARSLVAFRLT